jgi:hypothetical protein
MITAVAMMANRKDSTAALRRRRSVDCAWLDVRHADRVALNG